MPESIVKGIIYHHSPEEIDDMLCYAVCFSNEAAKVVERRLEGAAAKLPPLASPLGISPSGLEKICDESLSRYAEISARYSVR